MNKLLQNAFVSAKPVVKQVTVTDQETGKKSKVTVFVKPLSYQSAVEDLNSIGLSATEAVARRIAYSIMDESGTHIFTPEMILGTANPDQGPLSPELTMELLRVIGETSNLGKIKA